MSEVPCRILVVDDDTGITGVIKEVLDSENKYAGTNYAVDTANDIEIGTQMALTAQPPYKVIGVDVNMPGTKLSAARDMRAAVDDNHVPSKILVLSAGRYTQDDVKAGDDFLPKPFPIEELLNKIGALAAES